MYFYVFLCIFMLMARVVKKTIFDDLEEFRRRRGMNQDELAQELNVSQPHLSRVISGSAPPGNKLMFRIEKLLANQSPPRRADDWLEQVTRAAKRSPSFKKLIDSALDILKKR
jgi:transcriptional regulator with XRE-family HTH domain